jgi:hypothetical protein
MLYAQAESLDGESFGMSDFSFFGVFPRQAESDNGDVDSDSRTLLFYSSGKAALLVGRARCIGATALQSI